MKLISSLIASCLAFTSYAQMNDTTSTMEPTDTTSTEMSTTMYTTQETYMSTEEIVYETIPYDATDDPTNDLSDCDYYFMATLANDEVNIYICGYTDNNMGYTDIKLEIPSKRWVALGFSASATFDSDNKGGYTNFDGYNIIIPIQSDNIREAYYTADKVREWLESTITVIADKIVDDIRTLRLSRPQTISNLTDTSIDLSKYMDFEEFSECEDTVRISATYGPTDDERYAASSDRFTQETYGNREAAMAMLDEQDGELCDDGIDSGDDASHIVIFGALIIGFIAMLF